MSSGSFNFRVRAQCGAARCGTLRLPHGEVATPAFMPVATYGAVRGVSWDVLQALGAQMVLGNTFHLHERPGEALVAAAGGLHGFTGFRGPWLTDSGGFQVNSLSKSARRSEQGVVFRSPVDGSLREFTPERAMEIQHALGADIAMTFDEVLPNEANDHARAQGAMERSLRWAARCHAAHARLAQTPRTEAAGAARSPADVANGGARTSAAAANNGARTSADAAVGPRSPADVAHDGARTSAAAANGGARTSVGAANDGAQVFAGARAGAQAQGVGAPTFAQTLFGIVQGGAHAALRRQSARAMTGLGFAGYAHGGLGLGEAAPVRAELIEEVHALLPATAPRYLMGIGFPEDLLAGIARGVDLFDCVVPTRHARHGILFTSEGALNITAARFRRDFAPPDADCDCPVCARVSRAYLCHLLRIKERLGPTLASIHNLRFTFRLMERAREAISAGRFAAFHAEFCAASASSAASATHSPA